MAHLLVLLVVLATSLAAGALSVAVLRIERPRFAVLVVGVLDCLGFGVVFLGVNVGLGTLTVLILRQVTPWFATVYIFADVILVPLSFVQGLAFHCWRHHARVDGTASPARG